MALRCHHYPVANHGSTLGRASPCSGGGLNKGSAPTAKSTQKSNLETLKPFEEVDFLAKFQPTLTIYQSKPCGDAEGTDDLAVLERGV